jgi:hypothetical protein
VMKGTTPLPCARRLLRVGRPALFAIGVLVFVVMLTVVGGTAAALILTAAVVVVLVVGEFRGVPGG